MAEVRLSPSSYVVLGMIALRGPSTPYDLKRGVSHSVGYFWNFPHAQLYTEPERLTSLGLLDVSVEATGRRRRTYSLTETGRAALRAWLASPTEAHFEMRDVAELKLYFNEAGDPADVTALARDQIRRHRERIETYEDLVREIDDDGPAPQRTTTLELGLEMEYAALRFWTALDRGELDDLAARRAADRGALGLPEPAELG